MKKKIIIAVLLTIAAFSFRLILALRFPNDWPGDAVIYALLAKNTLHHHIYSSDEQEPLQPTYFRVPGYPLFLLAVYAKFGDDNNRAVRIIQAILDTFTCWLIALLAYQWSPADWEVEKRRRALLIALALASLCPFTAIYVAVVLTEVWATLFITLSALAATCGLKAGKPSRSVLWWLVAGLAAGAATMFRPDAGFFAAGAGVWLVVLGYRQIYRQWRKPKCAPPTTHAEQNAESASRPLPATGRQLLAKVMFSAVIYALGFAVVLAPWTVRNARVFRVFQPIAPASASMPGEFVPQGYNAWLRTWVDRESYTETVDWPLDQKPITIEQMPDYAFDSPEEKARVAALLDQYNNPLQAKPVQAADAEKESARPREEFRAEDDTPSSGDEDTGDDDSRDDEDGGDDDDDGADEEPAIVKMTPEIDAGFAEIAGQRKAHHPFRYYVITPLRRARYLWFTTHSGYYPFSGELGDNFDPERHQGFWLPLFMGVLWLYTILGVIGIIVLWMSPEAGRWLLLAALLIVPRFAYLATLQNPEPRYVVEFFPFVLALAALALAAIRFRRHQEGNLVS